MRLSQWLKSSVLSFPFNQTASFCSATRPGQKNRDFPVVFRKSATLVNHLLRAGRLHEDMAASPLSFQLALSLLAAGCQGFNRSQFLRFFKAGSCDHLNSNASPLSDVLLADRDSAVGPHMRCSTALWLDQSLILKPSFKRVLDSHYTAAFNPVDFDTKKKSFQINSVINHLKALARWSPPKDGVIKLNTSGCVIHRRGISGVGGLFRDAHGHMIRAYFRHLPHKTNSTQAEIIAIKVGLELAEAFDFDKYVVETDHEQISKILQMKEECKVKSEKLRRVLTLNGDNNVQILPIFRGANRCADYLAKHAAQLRNDYIGTYIFNTGTSMVDKVMLEELKRLLQYDKDGIKCQIINVCSKC